MLMIKKIVIMIMKLFFDDEKTKEYKVENKKNQEQLKYLGIVVMHSRFSQLFLYDVTRYQIHPRTSSIHHDTVD